MPTKQTKEPARGDQTREALIQAATIIFARDGFHAASTRAIADAAAANQALIGYHFGGKQGLYLAVFDAIAAEVQSRAGTLAAGLQRLLAEPEASLDAAARQARYLPPLMGIAETWLGLMMSAKTEAWSQLIVREQQHPTEAFNRVYDAFMGRMLGLLTQLVLRLRGDGDTQRARGIVAGLFGQILVWRVARAGMLRHMGWQGIGQSEYAEVLVLVRANIKALVLQEEVP